MEEYLAADERAHRIVPDEEADRGWKAMMLAPTIEICRALLRGERVPWWHLDFEQAERFKLRPGRERLERVSLADFNNRRG